MLKFNVTFETITEESAEDGDAADRGFEAEGATLREAIEIMGQGEGGIEADEYPLADPRWVTAYNVEQGGAYFEDGETVNRSIHFPDAMTTASKLRVCRLLGVHGA